MLQELASRNTDIKKLLDEGYEIEIRGGYLIIHHIPYVGCLERRPSARDDGKFVIQLNLSGAQLNEPFDHTAYFVGLLPCNIDGTPLQGVVNNSSRKDLGNGLMVDHYLSNKPSSGKETSYYEKVARYESIISRPAIAINPSLTAKTFHPIDAINSESPFMYIDTMSSRYDIQAISNKLANDRVAIIGLGGTGSYVLDYISKTHVKEIHLFDGDVYCAHNAFRSPGAVAEKEFERDKKKADYFAEIYGKMKRNVISHAVFISEDNISTLLNDYDFYFVCIDDAKSRSLVVRFLATNKAPFIDTGIGLMEHDHEILGQIRTSFCEEGAEDVLNYVPTNDIPQNDLYKTNIQIAEVNALNAALAVIRWKQYRGFYNNLNNYHQITYSINDTMLAKE